MFEFWNNVTLDKQSHHINNKCYIMMQLSPRSYK